MYTEISMTWYIKSCKKIWILNPRMLNQFWKTKIYIFSYWIRKFRSENNEEIDKDLGEFESLSLHGIDNTSWQYGTDILINCPLSNLKCIWNTKRTTWDLRNKLLPSLTETRRRFLSIFKRRDKNEHIQYLYFSKGNFNAIILPHAKHSNQITLYGYTAFKWAI